MYAYAPPGGPILGEQVIGGPSWVQTDYFDVEAKPEGDAPVLLGEQTKAMLQSLLEARFQLRIHREIRDLPVYNLVLKKSPKLSQDQTPPDPRQVSLNFAAQGVPLGPLPRGAMRMVTGPTITTLTGTAIPISRLISLLRSSAGRIIVDKTGFDGLIDVHLEFSQGLATVQPDAGVPGLVESGTSLFTAIEEIGLKLESGKAPLEVLVIDSAQRPSDN